MTSSIGQQRKILILGAGYLGSHLQRYLVDAGNEVFLGDIIGEKCSSPGMQVDLSDPKSVARLSDSFRDGMPEIVVVCVSAKGAGEEACEALYDQGIQHVIESFPVSRILFCSSTSLYGVTDGRWVTEIHTSTPLTAEAKTLCKAERNVKKAGGVVARLSAIYGPGRSVLLERFYYHNEALAGDPDRWINYIHRDDAVSALALLATADGISGKTFNITDSTPIQLQEIYSYMSNLLNRDMPVFRPPAKQSRRGKTNQRVSCALLMSYGWLPLYPSFLDGIHNVLEEMNLANN